MVSLGPYLSLLGRTWRQARRVSRELRYPLWKQARDLAQLRAVGIGPDDYYMYDLCNPALFPDQALKLTYRGRRYREQFRHFSHVQTQGIVFHKHILYRLLQAFDLPCPRIHAIYAPVPDCFERHRALTGPEQLARFLAETDTFPLFGKPSNASHGFGALGLRRREGDRIVLVTDESLPTAEVVERIHDTARQTGTYLLGELLQPREDFRRMCGSTLPSVRLVVLMRDGEPEPFRATILFPLDRTHVSNARGLSTGVCSGRVDLVTGRVESVIDSPGPHRHPRPEHPQTGARLEGYVIPEWTELVRLVTTAARAFSPFRMQHWDATFSTRGPALLELNFIGDVEPLQMNGPPGLYTEQFRSFERTHRLW
ncbi:MAG: sugar-transfer associated ATP-grasp domain-containing protein [Candidatus Krumholzibacteriia bacterium]